MDSSSSIAGRDSGRKRRVILEVMGSSEPLVFGPLGLGQQGCFHLISGGVSDMLRRTARTLRVSGRMKAEAAGYSMKIMAKASL
jgi:hypothetical protein